MAFRSVSSINLSRFNSSVSCNFLEDYESYLDKKSVEKASKLSSKTFAPSSFRCMRKSWFRLRGVKPDKDKKPDRGLDFTADIGTACHKIIQTDLKDMLKENWVSVEDFLAENPIPHEYTLSKSEDGLETRVEFHDIPIRFAVDGIVRIDDEYYLLEIKTSEFAAFNNLTQWKDEHEDQVKCYMTLLGIKKCLFLYQDRQYGALKCYQLNINEADVNKVTDVFKIVMDCEKNMIAPDRLPRGDKWCSMCEYKKSCETWG